MPPIKKQQQRQRSPSPVPIPSSFSKQNKRPQKQPPPLPKSDTTNNDEKSDNTLVQQQPRKRQRNHAAAAAAFNEGSTKIGRIRLLSKIAGNREATPDQDDIRAASEDDGEDVLAAVAAAVARDRVIEEELAEKKKESGTGENDGGGGGGGDYYGSDSEAEEDYLRKQKHIALAPSDQQQHEEEDAEVVEFDYGGAAYPPIREAFKKKRARWESAGGPAPAVQPGTLTHVGAGNAGDPLEMFASLENAETFAELGIFPPLALHLEALKFEKPTKVQQLTIPVLLRGRDALVKAPTGSGKTLAYLAPIMNDLATAEPRISRADGTLALIICPTRELCLQVVDVLTLLARRFVWVVPGAVHGGENRAKEKARLRKGVAVLVTTPGRLLDHLQNTESFRIDALKWMVLDEADRLLDLGFEKKIAEILRVINEKVEAVGAGVVGAQHQQPEQRRRSVLLSATLHGDLGQLSGLSLRNPVAIGFGIQTDSAGKLMVSNESDATQQKLPNTTAATSQTNYDIKDNTVFEIPKQLRQRYVEVPCKLRFVALAAILKDKIAAAPDSAKIVVFFSNCDSVEFHHAVLGSRAWSAAAGSELLPRGAPLVKFHGNMPQSERTASLLEFTKAGAGVLLCTDVAARGLDFPAVTAIIQFDPAGAAEEYVHRVGRTARLGHAGDALTFIQPAERGYIEYLRGLGVVLKEDSAVVAMDRTLGLDKRAGKNLPLERHHGAFSLQKEVMEVVAGDRGLRGLAEMAFRSFVRAYATHSLELKPFFSIKTLHLGHVAHSFALK